jgi:hypothetical protein
MNALRLAFVPANSLSTLTSLTMKGFGTFASIAENGFIGVRNCFMTVSRPIPATVLKKRFCNNFMMSHA